MTRTRILMPGWAPGEHDKPAHKVFITVTLTESDGCKRLSFTGVVGPYANGNAYGNCGQIVDSMEIVKYAEGWGHGSVVRLVELWHRWHLNDMRAGSPRQEEFLREWRKDHTYTYTSACDALSTIGLLIDSEHLVDGKPYKYGTKWLYEEVPAEIIEEIFSFPESEYVLPGPWRRD